MSGARPRGTAALALAFVERFGAGDLAGLEELLDERFRLAGPLGRFPTREAWLEALRADPPAPAEVEIHRILVDGDEAMALYELRRPPGEPLEVAQFFRLRNGRIADSRLIFDASSMRREGAEA